MYQECQGFDNVNKTFFIRKGRNEALVKNHFSKKLVFIVVNICIIYLSRFFGFSFDSS